MATKHFRRERYGDNYLFKLIRSGETIVGVTPKGNILAVEGATKDLTDDEWLELMRITSKVSEAVINKPKPFYVSSDYDVVRFIRLMPDKREGNQYAEVELTQDHRWRGKRGDVVLWLWQDLTPSPLTAE